MQAVIRTVGGELAQAAAEGTALLALFNERMQGVTGKYINAMGEHLKAIGTLTPSDVHRLTEMRRSGLNVRRIQREITRSAEISAADLNTVFRAVAESNEKFAEQWFGSSYTPDVKGAPKMSAPIERTLKAQLRVTAQEFKNLSQTTIQSDTYQKAVDAAVRAVRSGVADYSSTIRDVVREAGRSGLRVQYPSGLTRRLDTAVRQNVLDGVRSLNNDILQQLGNEYGADGIELSAHALCAEDHLPYQGRQFSDGDFEQLQNTLDRPFGMWNCRHTMFPIILGVSKPVHTPEELAAYARNSQELIEIDGRAKTRYGWTQEQRRIETAIRQQKDVANLAKACGDDTLRREAQANINALQDRYAQISKAAGLAEQPQRMDVAGFRSVKTVNELGDAEKFKNAVFVSEKVYKKHIDKHLAEYDGITEDEYIDHARKLLQTKPSDDILTLTRSDESISKYRISTNEFVVGTKEGNIRTAFKPKDRIDYWRDEIERNK